MPDLAFDATGSWRLHPHVAVRPEPFGALVYHFDTRRLSFLKSPELRRVVENLGQHPSAREACHAAGVSEQELPAYERALATLAAREMIVPGEG
jgi:putative mycofactocin binding protein MftB